ncbi:MAG: response regulator [Anaerolineae bacterium]
MTKILVIEDEHLLLEEILDLLSFGDFEAIGAVNGVEGVEMARREMPDLIVCDIMMPEMDGYEVLHNLRNSALTENIPFIFLTAKADKSDMRRGMELGADDYLTKPFTHNEMFSAINARLSKQAVVRRFAEKALDELRQSLLLTLPHELRTPLVGILGYGELLATEADSFPSEDVSRMARSIVNSAHRLHHLIENYLLYAQMEIVGTNTKRSQMLYGAEPSEFPDQVVTLEAARLAERYERTDDLHIDTEFASIGINEDHLRKIVGELVDNAFKFSRPGSPVKVSARIGRDSYRIAIGDSGRGMTADQVQSIGAYMQFERRLYEQQGSGLGLVIAKRLTEFYDGKFYIESVPGRGTSVSITFALLSNANNNHVSQQQSQGV